MSRQEHTQSINEERKFAKVAEAFSKERDVEVGGGKGFGSGALKVRGKIFAMLSSQQQFVVRLSTKRVDELLLSGGGVRFEPRPGKPMKEWLVLKADKKDWVGLAREACEFVRRGKP